MTASTNVTAEITLNVSACRMNGMSRLMRKNSIAVSVVGCRFGGSSRPSLGRAGCGRRMPDLADRDLRKMLAAAVDQIDDPARDEHRGEHRGEDAQAVDHREPADRSRAED